MVEPRIARWGSPVAERRSAWPGDELVAHPRTVWTHAVTVDRPAAEVWPWVAQLGQGRSGLYSYDWLENIVGCDVHSASRILPEFPGGARGGRQDRADVPVPAHNPVARFDPGRAVVLGDVRDSEAELAVGRARMTWAFIVQPVGAHSSRLVVRSRTSSAMSRVQGPVQFVMQRRSMLGIKERAEGTWSASSRDVIEPLLWLLAGAVAVRPGAGPSRSAGNGGSRSPFPPPRSPSFSSWPPGSRRSPSAPRRPPDP